MFAFPRIPFPATARIGSGTRTRPMRAESTNLAGVRVALRVCRVAAVHGAVEVAGADGVQVLGELVVGNPAFDQCESAAGVAEHVGVGPEQLQPSPDGGTAGRGAAPRPRPGGGGGPDRA